MAQRNRAIVLLAVLATVGAACSGGDSAGETTNDQCTGNDNYVGCPGHYVEHGD